MTFDIVHIDGERGLRGGERQLICLAAALKARGHNNWIACRRDSPLSREAARLGLETITLPFAFEWDPVTALELIRSLKKRAARPILHAHAAHAAGAAVLCRWMTGWPAVVHRRVDFALSGPVSARLKYGSADRIVAVSQAVKAVLASSGIPENKISVVADSVRVSTEECALVGENPAHLEAPTAEEKSELRQGLARRFEIPENGPLIGNLAALVPHKDHDTLLAAALIIALKKPRARFAVGGAGPEGPRLIRRVEQMGLEKNIFFLGQVEESAEFLRALDVFVLSSWGEGMGSVLLEAMNASLPIAATDAGGIPELVENGRTGLLSPARSAEALAQNILILINDKERARKLAQAAKNEVARFGILPMAEATEKVYASIA